MIQKQKNILIGRQEELKILSRYLNSPRAEFLAIYGRRRVGKTYLVREFFKDAGLFFEITGMPKANMDAQLARFQAEFYAFFNHAEKAADFKNWGEALFQLQQAVSKVQTKQKVILFFDELPWLSSGVSDFLSALDYMWNRHFSLMDNILVIVSGSAASWMINNVVNDTGGLYGRLSAHLRLIPFTLFETEQYLQAFNVNLPRKQICEIYMVTGGIPKYLSYLETGLSAAQNTHALCFKQQSPLLTEFYKLYSSLFQNAEPHLKIMRALATKRSGLNRLELIEKTKLPNNGRTSEIIRELEESGFILTLPKIGQKTKGSQYYLNDEYTLFYLTWIEPEKSLLLQGAEKDYWIKRQSSPTWKTWAGFAFESLCLKHIQEIKEGLQIGGVSTLAGYWSHRTKNKEVEIDLVIDRADNCINLCEIKFCNKEFTITKSYGEQLEKKKQLFIEYTGTKKAVFTTLITPYGISKNTHALTAVDCELTLDVLFG